MIAFRPDGGFYVLDVGNRRVQRFGPDREFIHAWGSFGSEPGQFNDPLSIVVEADGTVDVLDDVREVIESYDENGTVLRTIKAIPTEVGANGGANQLSLGLNGHFYVSMVQPNKVLEIDRDGALVATYGGPDSGEGAFTEQPNVMTFDSAGRLYVTQGPQRGNHPGVMVYGTDGSFIGGFGDIGGADTSLASRGVWSSPTTGSTRPTQAGSRSSASRASSASSSRSRSPRSAPPRAAPAGSRSGPHRAQPIWAIWMRLPQVSSRTAVVTGPISVGSWVKWTPRPRSRSNSAWTSATPNEVYGMPSSTSAALNGSAAGCASGSRSSSAPSGSSGETTVSQRCSPERDVVLLHEAEHVGVEPRAPSPGRRPGRW